MEKPLQMLLWGGFAVGVMTVGFFPTMWTVTQAGTAHVVVGNVNLAQTLWGGQSGYQGPTVPSSLSASIQYPQATSVPIIPGALTPAVVSLTWGTTTWPPSLTIRGTGFGNPVSAGETVTVVDTTRGWTATGVVQSFTNTKIVLSGFTPAYGGGDPQNWADGQGSFVFAPGDAITVSVTNPETGQAGTFQAQAPTNMPLPTVTPSSLSSQILKFGQSVTVSGSVTFNGQPLANQAVNLSATTGTFSGSGGTQATPGDFMVFTDSTGHFTASYTAPSTAGTQTLSAMAGSITATETAQVVAPPKITGVTWNTGAWPPSMTVAGSGLGSTGIVKVVENASGQGAVWDNNPNTPDNKLQVSTWNDTGISAGNFASYGAANGFYFAPGEAVGIAVTNGQTGQSASYTATYPTNAPMPTVLLSSITTINVGQSTVVTGNVSFDGTGLANQQVNLTASGGTLGTHTVQTDSNGNFSATYTAGNTGGAFSVTASSDTSSASANVTVNVPAPTVAWTYPNGQSMTQAQAQATGCGRGVVWSFTPPTYGGYSGWSQSWDNAWNQQQFTSTSGCLSPSGLSVGTHRVVLTFFFANGQTAQATSQPITITANPSVSINATTPLYSGASETITGTVTVGGSPDANVKVALSAPSGDGAFSSATVTTNGGGNFSDTYTAPVTSGTFTLSATSGGITGSTPIVVKPMQITGVTWNTTSWPPQLTVNGTGFGNSAGNVELLDETHGTWWDNTGQTGSAMNPANTGSDGMSASWGDASIGLSGYSGYGQNVGWHDYLTPGDAITIYAENTQTGQTASYQTTYPTNAPMPSVQFSSMPSIQAGQTVTISGSVSFGGQGLPNALVTLSASSGSFPSMQVTTNSAGDFSSSYTAPTSADTVTFTASAFTSQTAQSVSVAPPNVSVNGLSAIQTGQSETISGSVTTAGGAGLANVPVNLTTSGGSVSPTTVYTNGSGQWSSTYTASGGAGTYTVWAQSGGGEAGSNVSVTAPPDITSVSWYTGTAANPIWPPQVTISGSGFGQSASDEYVQLVDNTRGWYGATTSNEVGFTSLTWNNNQIVISGMSNYGSNPTWVFDPGDSVTVNVTNPQTGQTASFATTVPNMSVPMITTYVSQGWVNPGQAVTVTGTATFGGKPVPNQPITVSVYAGVAYSFNGASTYPGGPPITVDTNSTGNFTFTFESSGNSSPSAHQEGGGVNYGGTGASFSVMVRP